MNQEAETLKEQIVSHIASLKVFFEQASLKNCFSTTTHNRWELAYEYVKGLATSPSKRHMASIAQHCSPINNQAFSHFLSQSPWDHRKLVHWIMDHGWQIIGKKGTLVIDECANPKAGKHSVGVNRQYCGNMGKVDNCQVGVFMAYVKAGHRLLLDYRLYLPETWIQNPARCDASGIPREHQIFKTKAELAYELICEAVKAKIRFTHIAMDGFYGGHPWLLTRLERMDLIYVADIGSDERVYCECPVHQIPTKKGVRGREPTRKKVMNSTPVRVDAIMNTIENWREIRIRKSMDGFLEAKFYAVKVWRIDKEVSQPLPVWLLIRKELDDSETKYSFCNAIRITSWSRLVKMQSERYWIERSFQDANKIAGMSDYQVRNWNAWHHHMALVLLAMLWVTQELMHFQTVRKKITLNDIVRIIKFLFPLKVQDALSVANTIISNEINRDKSRRSKMKRKRQAAI